MSGCSCIFLHLQRQTIAFSSRLMEDEASHPPASSIRTTTTPPVEEAHKLDCVLKPTRFNIGVIREGCSFDGDSSLSPRAPVNAAD